MLRHVLICLVFLCGLSCKETAPVRTDLYESSLFKEVQLRAVFKDSKTFVDCAPRMPLSEILDLYEKEMIKEGFDTRLFIMEYFAVPVSPVSNFKSDTTKAIDEHISALWSVLTRQPDDYNPLSSLIPLPNPYIVPGGRFSEIYYWDSYFTMLGLQSSGRMDMVESMVDNFAFLIDSLGFIPNGNRNYYLSRSQPPYFSLMVNVLTGTDDEHLQRYLPALLKEYDFWMDGEESLVRPGDAFRHVVKLSDGTVMNRYWDNDPRPRPEAYKEDVHLQQESGRDAVDLYRNLRSACESGWDFSSRWFEQGKGLESIRTTELIPVDLNCLLYHHEQLISRALANSNPEKSKQFRDRAGQRRKAILTFMWDPQQHFFYDYHFPTHQRSHAMTLAGIFPLYFSLIPQDMANAATTTLMSNFLVPGGLQTTLDDSGQQWDAPNGWAPLQWIAYKGLRNYNMNNEANTIRERWLAVNERVYKSTGKMMEKYNVRDITIQAGGGEYPNQDGFGWTNGVVMAMMRD